MKASTTGVSLARWLLIGVIGALGVLAWRAMVPFGIDMPALDGQSSIDPRINLDVGSVGLGSRLSSVELRDQSGNIIAQGSEDSFSPPSPLSFGTRYTLKATAERAWFSQSETREISFSTVEVPKLESSLQQTVAPDGSVVLTFDRAVGVLSANGGPLKLEVQPDGANQSFRIMANGYEQGKTYPAL